MRTIKGTLGKKETRGTGDQSSQNGAHCKNIPEKIPKFNWADCEKHNWKIEGNNNNFIVLGRDRWGDPRIKGYGSKAETRTGMIDIVVGRTSANIVTEHNGKKILTNPDFKLDAARIYLSQKADIDTYFGIEPGGKHSVNQHPPIARSAVGIKADDVRIIARESIKIVTGTDNKDSNGGPLSSRGGGIDLIAGNPGANEPQQPLVKGANLKNCLKSILKHIDDLAGILNTFIQFQSNFNKQVAVHTHPVITEKGISMMATGKPNSIKELASPKLSVLDGPKVMLKTTLVCQKDILKKKGAIALTRAKYIDVNNSEDYICSSHNTTN